jgi:hypothetical protein
VLERGAPAERAGPAGESRGRRAAALLVGLASVGWLAAASTAGAQPQAAGPDAYLAQLAAAARARVDALVEGRAPRLAPPVPVPPRWRPTRLGSLELGAPLAALAAADLDADGRGELYAVTSREVVAIAIRGGRASELGRVAFTGPRALAPPRDPVGTAVVDGGALVAASAAWSTELRVAWQGSQLVARPGAAAGASGGLLVCPQERAALAPGRNYFGPSASASYGVRCRRDLVDAAGYPLRVRARLAVSGKLAVAIERCAPDGGTCLPLRSAEVPGVGAAFDLADVDRDGTPDVIATDDAAAGEPDAVRVVALRGGPAGRALFRRAFQAGVAGVAAVDSDGDGVEEVVAAVRLAGATRVDLWRL